MPDWIPIETAAKRSGKSVGHLSRLCRDKWQGEGKARLIRTAAGGKAQWHIREDADAAFAAVKFPEQLGVDLRKFPAAKREQAMRRRKILLDWEQHLAAAMKLGGFSRQQATAHFLERLLIAQNITVSRATLYNWEHAYRAEGLPGLIDSRGVKADQPAKDDPFLAEVQRLYLSLRQPKLSICVRMAEYTAREQGWTVRDYKACQRHIKSLPAGLVIKMRGGEDAYVARAEPYIERDYTSLQSNQAWNADHHQFDVVVNAGGKLVRPWLSVFQDVRSRKIMGWRVIAHDPNSDVILSVFRQAVLDHGVPESLYIDNGKDYDCAMLNGRTKKERWQNRKIKVALDEDRAKGLFPQLGIEVCHVWAYHGQSKIVERWFGTMEQATVFFPTYCGRSAAHKPEDLQLNLERGKAPSLEDFTAWFADWLAAHEASHQHQGDGMDGQTPNEVYAQNLHTKRTAPADLIDLLCLPRVGPLRVGRNGVTYKSLRYGQYEAALQRRMGELVYLRVDERDLSNVQVYTERDELICLADSNVRLSYGADAQTLRAAIKSKKQDRELHKTYIDRRPRITEDLPDRLVRAAAVKAREIAASNTEPPPPGPTIRPVRHALEEQLPAVQRAVERREVRSGRVAVGAEFSSRFVYQPSTPAGDAGQEPGHGLSMRELMANRPNRSEQSDE